MRTLALLLTATLLPSLAARPAVAQDTFEGVIEYQMSGGGMDMAMTWSVKGQRMRQEMQGPMGAMVSLVDSESGVVTMLMPAQKMYMRMNTSEMMKRAASQAPVEQPKPEDFRATGEKETIAGHTCEHYAYTGDDVVMDVCIASGLGYMPMAQPPSAGGAGAAGMSMADFEAWRARFEEGFLMLAMEVTQEGQTVTMRATSIEQKTVPEELFELPDGFTEMRMPGH